MSRTNNLESTNTLVSIANSIIEPVPQQQQQQQQQQQPAQVKSSLNLNVIKGYSQKKATIQQNKLIADITAELNGALSIFDKGELYLNHSVVLFVAQIVEDIFNKTGQGDIKLAIVSEVCKPFFDNNHDLVTTIVDLIFHQVVKTSFFRRNKNRIKSFFFVVLKAVFGLQRELNLTHISKI